MEKQLSDTEIREKISIRLNELSLVEFFEIPEPDGSIVVELRGIPKEQSLSEF